MMFKKLIVALFIRKLAQSKQAQAETSQEVSTRTTNMEVATSTKEKRAVQMKPTPRKEKK